MNRAVILESPFAGRTRRERRLNRRYLNDCIRDCVLRGETPYASHKMLTDSLDDMRPREREIGINAGFEMRRILRDSGAVTVVYEDRGISRGMQLGIEHSEAAGVPVIRRTLRNYHALYEASAAEDRSFIIAFVFCVVFAAVYSVSAYAGAVPW